MDDLALGLFVFGMGLAFLFVSRAMTNYNKRLKDRVKNSPVPIYGPVKPETTCSAKGEPHKWEEMVLMNPQRKTEEAHQVCTNCGVIFGIENQFYAESLGKLRSQFETSKRVSNFYIELDAFRESERERRANAYGLDKSVFLAGFQAFTEIEQEIAEKIDAKRDEEIQLALKRFKEDV